MNYIIHQQTLQWGNLQKYFGERKCHFMRDFEMPGSFFRNWSVFSLEWKERKLHYLGRLAGSQHLDKNSNFESELKTKRGKKEAEMLVKYRDQLSWGQLCLWRCFPPSFTRAHQSFRTDSRFLGAWAGLNTAIPQTVLGQGEEHRGSLLGNDAQRRALYLSQHGRQSCTNFLERDTWESTRKTLCCPKLTMSTPASPLKVLPSGHLWTQCTQAYIYTTGLLCIP